MKRLRFPWVWWWELPGHSLWMRLGFDPVWSINERGLAAWPGMVRCLFRPHADDSYGNCCYCGKSLPLSR